MPGILAPKDVTGRAQIAVLNGARLFAIEGKDARLSDDIVQTSHEQLPADN